MMGANIARRARPIWLATLLATTAVGGLAATPALAQSAQAGQDRTFDIPPQPLEEALIQFGRQSGYQVSADTSLTQDARSLGVKGQMGALQALSMLLAGTGLTYRINGSMVALERAPKAAGGAIQLGPVRVEGQSGDPGAGSRAAVQSALGPGVGYVATQSVTGTKTETPILETPQSISVVTRQQMDDQDVQNVAQALRYTPSVIPELRGSWTRYDQFSSRGFELDSNEFLDGLRLLPGYQATPQIDQYFLDRIEVVKGPASVLYGALDPGGALNMVSKRPVADPYHEIGLQSGSYGDVQGTLDVSGPLNADKSLLYRVTGLVLDSGAQVDHERDQRFAVAPALTWRPDADTSLTILANFQYDPKGGFYDFLPYQGTVVSANGVKIPTNFYTGDLDYSKFQRTQISLGYAFEHRIDDVWTVRQNLRYMHIDATDYLLQGEGWDQTGATLARYAWNDKEDVNALALDNQAQAKFATGAFSHTLLFGVDYQRDDADERYGSGGAPDVSLVNPEYHLPVASFADQRSFDQVQSQTGLYAQDQVRIGKWAFLAGLRQDWSDTNVDGKVGVASSKISESAFTWRAGAVYLFDNGLAPYFSYATSFNPQAGAYFDGTPFKPTTGRQYEAGIKYQAPGLNSFVTVSAFDLSEQNVPTMDPDPSHGAFAQVQTGEIRSRGVELEGHLNLTSQLSLVGAYAYMSPKVTKDTTYQGLRPVQIPENTASLWADYTFSRALSPALAGFGLGGGVRYIGSTWADQANTLKVPSFTVFDLAGHYDLGHLGPWGQGALLSVNVSNLFDRTYVSSCDSEYTCYYGLRRRILVNVRYRF